MTNKKKLLCVASFYNDLFKLGGIMAKTKTKFVCSNCGHETTKWMGQCLGCKEWNTLLEEVDMKGTTKTMKVSGSLQYKNNKSVSLDEISSVENPRIRTGVQELDRVLGGGIVEGGLILVGGDPGIGKSTLMLQICRRIGKMSKKILYVSGEESLQQIKLRAKRLKVDGENVLLYTETNMSKIEETVLKEKPAVLMIDSIQTMYSDQLTSVPGSVSQVREVTAHFMRLAKQLDISTFIVGHVTKDGAIAGPRMLEHMVDTVLYFEGDKNASYRILRAVKNRFGSTNEMGIFEMTSLGLKEVLNPSEYMLSGRPVNEPGSLVVCGMEGSRPIFVEVQALTAYTTFNIPRRTVTGMDYNRVVMLIAVIEKKYGISMQEQDCFVNIAGGIKLNEPALDLGVLAAIISSMTDIPVNPKTVLMGEIGLTGEVRGITFIETRVKEAKKLGFTTVIIPKNNIASVPKDLDIEVIGISHISELKQVIFSR